MLDLRSISLETQLYKVIDRDGHLASACTTLCVIEIWDLISHIRERNPTTFCLFSIGLQFPADRTRLSAHRDVRRHPKEDCSGNRESQMAIVLGNRVLDIVLSIPDRVCSF